MHNGLIVHSNFKLVLIGIFFNMIGDKAPKTFVITLVCVHWKA